MKPTKADYNISNRSIKTSPICRLTRLIFRKLGIEIIEKKIVFKTITRVKDMFLVYTLTGGNGLLGQLTQQQLKTIKTNIKAKSAMLVLNIRKKINNEKVDSK